MLRDERDRGQSNPYVAIFVDDHPNDRAEIGRERSMLRAAIVGFCYVHHAFIAGSPLLEALIGAGDPLGYWPDVLFFGLEGMQAAFVTVVPGYVFVFPVLLLAAFGIVNGIIVNHRQSHQPGAFFLWCSAINMCVCA